MARFGLTGRIAAQPGQSDALAEVLLDAARVLEANDDCLVYIVSRLPDDPDAVLVTEVWESEEAHAASLQRDDVLEVIARGRPLIGGMTEQTRHEPLGGKGLR